MLMSPALCGASFEYALLQPRCNTVRSRHHPQCYIKHSLSTSFLTRTILIPRSMLIGAPKQRKESQHWKESRGRGLWCPEYRTLRHLANSAPANSAPLKLGTHNLGTLQTRHPQTRHMHNYKLGTWLKTLNLPRLQTRHPVGNWNKSRSSSCVSTGSTSYRRYIPNKCIFTVMWGRPFQRSVSK